MHPCAVCGTQNPTGQKFCGECGTPMAVACTVCATTGPPGSKFCGECGAPLGAAPAPATAVVQRRVCSVLFADLVGFTPLAEARDHEEVRALLSGYFDTARTVIERYGGVVEKFIGDAVMGVWGTPVASESDAERAVRAGLDLVAAIAQLGVQLGADGMTLRVGVVTGEVTASLGAVGEGMVAGDAVNTAARVQSAAAPGTVWVDSSTQRLASAAIGFADEGEHLLKGKTGPQQLWRATRVLSSVGGAQRPDGLEAPLIGRGAELSTIKDLFHATAERRASRLVTVVGPAGSGKSRLGWEFEKYTDGVASDVFWHRGRCLTYGDGVAFWALAQALRQRLEIAEEDAGEDAVRKLVEGVERHIAIPAERGYVGVRIGRLLAIRHPEDTGAPLERDELFAGWRLFLERLADRDPVVVLIDDAQYADDGLLDFVEHVVDWARGAAIYWLLLARDELLERRPSLGIGRHRTALPVAELDADAVRSLVAALVPGVPDEAVDAIVAQTHGNPLFAVETVRALIDNGVLVPGAGGCRVTGDLDTLSVPDSLHGLLAARLDALGPNLRALVADAAVLGTSFPGTALAAVSVASAADVTLGLAELVRRDILIVSADPLSPERGNFVFAQGMLRQVAYETMSRRDRRSRHLAVAEHLQRVFPDGGEGMMDVVAAHYLDALAALPGEDDAQLRGQAVAALERAGERSIHSGAPARAARSFRTAADLVGATDRAAAARLWERALDAHGATGQLEQILEAGDRARAAYLDVGDERAAAFLGASIGTWLGRWRRLTEARPYLVEAEERLRDEPGPELVGVLAGLAMNAVGLGEYERGRRLCDDALRIAPAAGVSDVVLADLFGTLGLAELCAVRPLQAEVHLRHAVELSVRAGDLRQQARNLNNLASTYLITDPSQAVGTARMSMECCRRSGDRAYLSYAASTVMEAMLLAGDWREALAELDEPDEVFDGDYGDDRRLVHVVLLALTGEQERARALAELPGVRESDDVNDLLYAAWVDAHLAVAEGDLRGPLEALALVWSSDIDLSAPPVVWMWGLAFRSACQLADIEAVRELVKDLDAHRRGAAMPAVLRADHDLAGARVADLDGGAPAVVGPAYAAAVTALRAAGSPYHLAHALLDEAEFLGRSGHDVAALREEAEAIGQRLGAVDIARRLDPVRAR